MSSVVSFDARRDLGLAFWQARYELRAFARNRTRGLFTFIFPLMFLVIFASLDKSGRISSRGNIAYDDFFVPGILAYAAISTTFVNMAISTALLRDQGVLKRMQGTPLPRWAYVAGRIMSVVVIVLLMSVFTLALGHFAYALPIRARTIPAVIVALILGTAAFTTLGIGIVRLIPNADAAPAVVNIAILPLSFISGIFFVTDGIPKFLRDIANIFPVHALADSLQYAFDPHTRGAGFQGTDLRTLAIWTVIGVLAMVRFLRTPLGDGK
jgi:ABC-2 type transport system permease protein